MEGLDILGTESFEDYVGAASVPDEKPVVARLNAAARRAQAAASKLDAIHPQAANKLRALSAKAGARGSNLQRIMDKARGAAKAAAATAVKPTVPVTSLARPVSAPSSAAAAVAALARPVTTTVAPSRGAAAARFHVGQGIPVAQLAIPVAQLLAVMDAASAFADQVDDAGIAAEVISFVQPLLDPLQAAGQMALATAGNNLVLQANQMIDTANSTVDTSTSVGWHIGDVTQAGTSLMNQALPWIRQARAVLAPPPVLPSPVVAPPVPVVAPTTPVAPEGGMASGGGGGGGGGDSGAADEGDTGAPGDEGGAPEGDEGSGDEGYPDDSGDQGDMTDDSQLSSDVMQTDDLYAPEDEVGKGGGGGHGGGHGGHGGHGGGRFRGGFGPGWGWGGGPWWYGDGYELVDVDDDMTAEEIAEAVARKLRHKVGGGGGHGGGGHHHGGGGFRGGRGGFRGGPWYGGPWYDEGGLELLDVVTEDTEPTVDDVVNAIAQKLKEKKAGVIVGAYDIQQSQRQMNTLKQITVAIGRALVKHGMQVSSETIAMAQGGLFQSALPGITSMTNTLAHLQWHADALSRLSDPTAIYPSGDDLKKWTMQAFIDANAVEEGRARQEQIWTEMWTEIGEEMAKLPQKIIKAVAALPGQVFEAATGVPTWVFWAGGAAVVVLLGVGVWKLLKIATPVATAVATRRYT